MHSVTATLPGENWKYVGFLCNDIIWCSVTLYSMNVTFTGYVLLFISLMRENKWVHSIYYSQKLPDMFAGFHVFLSNCCGRCFTASHTKRHLGKTQCVPAGKGMGSQQAFGIWYANVSEQVDMIKVNEWETIPDFSYYCIALNICWHFLFLKQLGSHLMFVMAARWLIDKWHSSLLRPLLWPKNTLISRKEYSTKQSCIFRCSCFESFTINKRKATQV